ncbi:GxxExxY protein [Chryseotalea sanaruensis]|uniref:GxxExxY protein n=1 Tax=Chryseotalea sanaruensis TaxID=2482724 RepID=A0A401U688_9BACT|nr:GxxExxY protein [Chryseotalea sanaruensis]GCC50448.1 GxxExxY protein [Chryseotalea sanaruensis]
MQNDISLKFNMADDELKYSAITGKVIGCAMEVHTFLGNGFQEVIYQRSLAYEMELQKLGFAREYEMPVVYKEKQVGSRRVDFLVENLICVEIKALIQLEKVHMAQALNYLEAYNLEVGLLLNFGSTRLEFHRLRNKKFVDVNHLIHPIHPNHHGSDHL